MVHWFVAVIVEPLDTVECRILSARERRSDVRLWRDVTAKLKLHNVAQATEHKHSIEQRQRDDAKRRLETGEAWDTRVTMMHWRSFLSFILYVTLSIHY